MKIFLETFGCQMNRLDSELVTGLLLAAGHEMTPSRESAEAVLFNTCSVRAQAENKVYTRLGEEDLLVTPRIVGVLGCLAQRLGKSLHRRFRCVNIICAPGRLGDLADMIDSAAADNVIVALDPDRRSHPKDDTTPIDSLDIARDANQTPTRSKAFVRVMKGCDNFCTYCIVPYVRGPEISRNPDAIVAETRRLVDAGRSEITLLGQTVNRYHWSAGEQTVRFSDLLERISPIAGLHRLRFVTSHPLDFTDDILHAIRDLPNICPYIHCPPQSGSDTMLRRMNRKYTRKQYDDLIDRARAIVPDVVLVGDFIVGFPGETEEDHQASANLIRRSGFKNSFIFKYSPRPGTPAATKFTDDIPFPTKRRRNNELLAVQAEVGLSHHQGYVGKTVEILVEGPSRRSDKQKETPAGEVQLSGRTTGDHIVIFNGPQTLADQYTQIKITRATALTLFGKALA